LLKKILLSTAVLFLLLIAVVLCFDQEIKAGVSRWCIQNIAKQVLGQKIHYEALSVRGRHLIIDSPEFFDTTADDDGGYRLRADQLLIGYRFDWKDRALDLDVSLNGAEVFVAKPYDDWPQLPLHPLSPSRLKVRVKACIDRLELQIGDAFATLGIEGHFLAGHLEGSAQLALNGEDDKPLVFVFSGSKDGGEFGLDFLDTDGPSLLGLVQVAPEKWILNTGRLRGGLSGRYSSNGEFSMLEGDLGLFSARFEASFRDLGATLSLGEAHLSFDDVSRREISFIDDVTLNLGDSSNCSWILKDLKGGLLGNAKHDITVDISGRAERFGQELALHIGGGTHLLEDGNLTGQLALRMCDNREQEVLSLKSHIEGNSVDDIYVKFQMEGASVPELLLLQKTAPEPHRSLLHFDRGDVSLSLYSRWVYGNLVDLRLEHFHGRDLGVRVPPYHLRFDIPDIQGDLGLDLLADNPISSLQADIAINAATIHMQEELLPHVDAFSAVTANVILRDGVVNCSTLKGNWGSIFVDAEIDWSGMEDVIKLRLDGDASGIAAILPSPAKERILDRFTDEPVGLLLTAARKGQDTLSVKGGLTMGESIPTGESATVTFSCDVEPLSSALWGDASEETLEVIANDESSVLMKTLPPLLSPLAFFQGEYLKKELGWNALVLRNGVFRCESLPLKKFFSPFVFLDPDIALSGIASIDGAFDLQSLTVRYGGQDLLFDGPLFRYQLPFLISHTAQGQAQRMPGVHHLDFVTGKHFGSFPAEKMNYLHKSSGLVYENVSGVVHFGDHRVSGQKMSGTCEGLEFEGRVDYNYDFSEKRHFEVKAQTDRIKGPLAGVRRISAHFSEEGFAQLPLEGWITSGVHDASMTFTSTDGECKTDMRVHAHVSDAVFGEKDRELRIEPFSCDFDFDWAPRYAKMTSLRGDIAFAKGENREAFPFEGATIEFHDFSKNKTSFYFPVYEGKDPLALFVGESVQRSDDTVIDLHFDREKTHVFQEKPKTFDLALRSWSQVEALEFRTELPFEPLIRQVDRIAKASGCGRAVKAWTEKMDGNSIKCVIDFEAGELPLWNFVLFTRDLRVGQRTFEHVFFEGKKNDHVWTVEKLSLDKIKLAAELHYLPSVSKLKFFNLNYPEIALFALEGEYDSLSNHFDGMVKMCDLDLESLQKEGWIDIPKGYQLEGFLRGTGSASCRGPKEDKDAYIHASVNCSLFDGAFAGCHDGKAQDLTVEYDSLAGWKLENLETRLRYPDKRGEYLQLKLDRLVYHPKTRELSFRCPHFSFPNLRMPWLIEFLEKNAGAVFDLSVQNMMLEMRKEGEIAGECQLVSMPNHWDLEIGLEDGDYRLWGQTYRLRNCQMDCNSSEFRWAIQYLHYGRDLSVLGLCDRRSPRLNERFGRLSFIECDGFYEKGATVAALHWKWNHDDFAKQIQAHWGWNSAGDLEVSSVEGHLTGAEVHLNPAATDASILLGGITLDAKSGIKLIPEGIADAFDRWDVGNSYCLTGQWKVPQKTDETLSFKGVLTANDCILNGITFDLMHADINYNGDIIYASNCAIMDASGQLEVEKLLFVKNEDEQWFFSLPHMKIENLQPSLFKTKAYKSKKGSKSLVLRKIELHNLVGDLSDMSSFIGGGTVDFVNPTKRNSQNNLIPIPNEVMLRMGLDLDVLNPVGGSISYDIEDGKIYMNEFKDMYSEGRVSQFFLSNTAPRSYVDFDGNMNLRVKMKQHNILFKLAELFTVTVQGTLARPAYAIQKQADHIAEPQVDEMSPELQKEREIRRQKIVEQIPSMDTFDDAA
jgi:hypothetical protein